MKRSVVMTESDGRWAVQMFDGEQRVWTVENISREQAQHLRADWLDHAPATEAPKAA